MRNDWHRQRDEPDRAHALFEQYLQLGPRRNLRTLASRSGVSYSYLKKLSHLWRWRERAAGWQMTIREAAQVDPVNQVAEARKRQIRDAHTLIQLSRAQLAGWMARDQEGTMRLLRRLTPHQTARFWQAGYRVEHGLLPPLIAEKPVDVEQTLRHDSYEREREQRRERERPRRRLNLREKVWEFVRVLRRSGMSPSKVRKHHAQLSRWLWLPDEKSLSVEALKKAYISRRRKGRPHGKGQRKAS